jgi:hypothetical protein
MSGHGDCRHFRGIQHDRCHAGQRYEVVRRPGAFALPCLNRPQRVDTCAAYEPLTNLEADTQEAELTEAIADVMNGICGKCGEPMVGEPGKAMRCPMCPDVFALYCSPTEVPTP